jgi:hypothetical protein
LWLLWYRVDVAICSMVASTLIASWNNFKFSQTISIDTSMSLYYLSIIAESIFLIILIERYLKYTFKTLLRIMFFIKYDENDNIWTKWPKLYDGVLMLLQSGPVHEFEENTVFAVYCYCKGYRFSNITMQLHIYILQFETMNNVLILCAYVM